MSKIGGFFVPDPISGSYVANKRNEQGSLKYDADRYSIGMQKQAALQDLEKSYEGVINKAYNSYLANQQAIAGTTMGQGYKEMYEEAERQNLIAQQEQAATNVASVKAQLLAQEQEALQLVQQQGAAEVANLSRVARTMSDYLTYVGSLSSESGGTGYDYLSQLSGKAVTKDTLAEDIYESLFSAQPTDYTDENSNRGMSYSQWLHNQMSNTEEDMAFEQWVFSGGGWLDFQKMAGLAKDTTEEGLKYQQIESKRKGEYDAEIAKIEEAERKAKEEAKFAKSSDFEFVVRSAKSPVAKKGDEQYELITTEDGYSTVYSVKNMANWSDKLEPIAEQINNGNFKRGDIIRINGKFYFRTDDGEDRVYRVKK